MAIIMKLVLIACALLATIGVVYAACVLFVELIRSGSQLQPLLQTPPLPLRGRFPTRLRG
jgi:hypothetical protein